MKHSGRAFQAGLKLILVTLGLAIATVALGRVAAALGSWVLANWTVLASCWVIFSLFTLYFFRDPDPFPSNVARAIVAPAHGTVDLIDEIAEPQFMGGVCQRISIFLSVIDVHVQNAPVNGQVACVVKTPGQFLSATKSDCAAHNENTFIGFEVVDFPGQKIAVRQIAGLIARRIITWVEPGEKVPRSERIGLIQFGSRVELYLPKAAKIQARLGDKVKGGETILAVFEGVESIYKS